MTENPDFINLKFSSFKKKEEYKPPSTHNLFFQKPKKTTNKKKFVPGGEWADDKNSEEEIQKISKTSKNQNFAEIITNPNPSKKKTSKFSFIKKNKKKKIEKKTDELLSFSSIKSEEYNFEKKLVNEIIQPVGATKKPQETLLVRFSEKSASFEPYIILSIIYYVLSDSDYNWISKLRALYCIDFLLKQKKYFDFMKKKIEIVNVVEEEEFKEVKKSAWKNIKKLKKKILGKLEGNFCDGKMKGFDMKKLEDIKESSNKNFFAKMENLKKKENLNFLENSGKKKNDMDLLDFDFEKKNEVKIKKIEEKKKKENLVDIFDVFNIESGDKKNLEMKNKKNENLGNLDIFGFSENKDKVNKKNITNDFIFENNVKEVEKKKVDDPFDFLSL